MLQQRTYDLSSSSSEGHMGQFISSDIKFELYQCIESVIIIAGISAVYVMQNGDQEEESEEDKFDPDATEEDFDDQEYECESEEEDFDDQREVTLHQVELCGHFYSYLEICYNILGSLGAISPASYESLFNICGCLCKFKVFLQFIIFLHTLDEWNILRVWKLLFFEVLLTRYRDLLSSALVRCASVS